MINLVKYILTYHAKCDRLECIIALECIVMQYDIAK